MAIDGESRHAFSAGRVVSALVVIAIGAMFLARNFGIELSFLNDTNWWAWIILMAAAWPVGTWAVETRTAAASPFWASSASLFGP